MGVRQSPKGQFENLQFKVPVLDKEGKLRIDRMPLKVPIDGVIDRNPLSLKERTVRTQQHPARVVRWIPGDGERVGGRKVENGVKKN